MPGAVCSAPGCRNARNKDTAKFRMVRYPRDDNLKKIWLQIIGRSDWEPYKEARLCDAHFSADQWQSPFRLKKGAVPRATPVVKCSCQESVARACVRQDRHDHPYASPASRSCKIHGIWVPDLKDVLKENCALQDAVAHLQARSPIKNVDSFSSPLKSIQNIQYQCKKRGKSFTPEQIRHGLQLRFACGSSGYNSVRKLVREESPLPSIRLLQLKTEHLKFAPGILHEVLEAMKKRFDGLSDDRDHDVNLVFDELAIKQRVDFDASLKKYIGHGTLPGHGHLLAEKGEVFVFRGCHRKFKQIVAYHLNPSTVNMQEKKLVIIELLQKAKDIGANVVALVCDMGNRGLLATLGFSTQKDSLRFCIKNPVSPDQRLWCVADPVHVFKALKECLCNNRFIELPASVVTQYDLPSAMVDLSHIEWLEKFQRDENLHLVPGLTLKDLASTHFSKMKVKSSHKIINHKVASSLSYLVLKDLVPPAFETTAWFIKLMNRWFELTTSRGCQVALGLKNEEVYQAALDHFHLVVKVFEGARIAGAWKPVQSHIIFTTKSILEIQNFLIHEKKYQFLFTGNFTSDVVENVVCKVRMTNPTPSALEFKNRLKHLVISHFNGKISSSSYDYDDAEDLVDLLLTPDDNGEVQGNQAPFDVSSFKWTPCIPAGAFKSHVEDVLYRMCGYVIISLMKKKILNCQACIKQLQHEDDTPHPKALFQILTDYIPGAQFPVKDVLFRLLLLVEYNLLLWATKLQQANFLDLLIESVVQPAVAPYFDLGTCHDVKKKIVKAFCVMRFRQLGVHVFSPSQSLTSTCLSSKTAGGHYLTSNYRQSSQKVAETPKRNPKTNLKRLIEQP